MTEHECHRWHVACRAERSVTPYWSPTPGGSAALYPTHQRLAPPPGRMRRLRAGLRSCRVAPGARFEMPQARTCRFETRAGPAHRSHCQWARVSPRRIGPASESLGCMGRGPGSVPP